MDPLQKTVGFIQQKYEWLGQTLGIR